MHGTHIPQPYDLPRSLPRTEAEPESLWTPAPSSSLARARESPPPALPRINVNRNERVASSLVGGFLLARALTHRSSISTLLGMLGSALVYRGVSGHCQLYQALGIDTAARA